jgi:hypothetical protein
MGSEAEKLEQDKQSTGTQQVRLRGSMRADDESMDSSHSNRGYRQ